MTDIKQFNTEQDALTVFLNYGGADAETGISKLLEESFAPMEFLYLEGQDCEKNGTEFYQLIKTKIQDVEVMLPRSQKFVFCHYLSLNRLNRSWVDSWQERIREFQNRLPVDDALQQYHVICLTYNAADEPLGEQKREAAVLIKRLAEELPEIAHVTYLLHTSALETMTRQIRGLMTLLYLLSRRESAGLLHPMQRRTSLKVLNYADYSSSRVKNCQIRQAEIKRWLNEHCDTGLLSFIDKLYAALADQAQEIRDAVVDYSSRQEMIYPVHVDDFMKRGLIGGSRIPSIDSGHPILQQRRKMYFKELQKRLQGSLDLSEVRSFVMDRLLYEDLCELKELLDIRSSAADSLESRIRAKLNVDAAGDAQAELEALLMAACAQLRDLLKDDVNDLEGTQRDRQKSYQLISRELEEAGRYADVQECFSRIAGETDFKLMKGRSPEYVETWCLLGSECSQQMNGYCDIYKVNTAYYCSAIDPVDIALLKTGCLLDCEEDDAEKNLVWIL